jgi:hypothetical protein
MAGFLGLALCCGAGAGPAEAQFGPESVALLDRLCAQNLRSNEEDRLYGMISFAVRATIRYRGGTFQREVIDNAVQESLNSLIEDCPELTEVDPSKRLDMAVNMISDATTKVLGDAVVARKTRDKDSPYNRKPVGKNTAADLSQVMSSQEIDQWLNSLPPRERALSLFLYSSDVTPREIAAAVGEPAGAMAHQLAAGKADLLRIYSENWQEPISGPRADPAIKYSEAGEGFAALMKSAEPPASAPPPVATTGAGDAPPGPAPSPPLPPVGGGLSSLKVTGISADLFSGWSLLATARDLPRGQRLSVTQPFLLEPDAAGGKRMLVTDIAEIGRPDGETRRFLLKAYAIDADKNGASVRDSFHTGGPLANDDARKTLANPNLSSIEVARCLWHDFATGPDPGLCRTADASAPGQSGQGAQGGPNQ